VMVISGSTLIFNDLFLGAAGLGAPYYKYSR